MRYKILSLIALSILIFAFSSCKKEEKGVDMGAVAPAIDLGLRTKDGKPLKWAQWNLGARCEGDQGFKLAWGQTDPNDTGVYKWGTYNWNAFTDYGMTKYNNSDGITNLLPEDDAARVLWGPRWRTPTIDELHQLANKSNFNWTETTKTNSQGKLVRGYQVTSKLIGFEGRSIFLPFLTFDSNYWSSSLVSPDVFSAYELFNQTVATTGRDRRILIRAVAVDY